MKLKIEKLIYEGYGLGRTKDRPVFVSKSVPGDELEVDILKDNKSFQVGNIKSVITPSPKRIEPKCKHFSKCGGCDHQNISYPDQLKYKNDIFKEVLRRQGVIPSNSEQSRDPSTKPQDDKKLQPIISSVIPASPSVIPASPSVIPAKAGIQSNHDEILCQARDDNNIELLPIIPGSNHPFFYRNSIRFFIKKIDDKFEFCRTHYHISNNMIMIDSCLLQSETSNRIMQELKTLFNKNGGVGSLYQIKIRQGKMTGEFMVELITNDEKLVLKEEIVDVLKNIGGIKSIYHTVTPVKSLKNAKRHLVFGSPIIFEKIGKYTFQISPESFFQTNSLGAKVLYDTIKDFAKVDINEKVLDLYCGTGSIGIYLSTLAKSVLGVDSVKSAIRDATDNARMNRVSNCSFQCADVLKFISSSVLKFDVIIVDPPRAGLKKNVVEQILKIDFKRLIYVSCNPATFARDIKFFESKGVKVQKVQPIDMFPQTHHIELVANLTK